jgi:O-antigen/teichoic acid export membrane protein
MNLGVKFFVIQIAVLVIYQTSNIIIAQISGPEDVTVYNVAFKYFGVALMLFSIILTPFWSSFTDAFFLNDYDWMRKTVSVLRKIALALCFVVVMMVVASDLVYKIWTSGLVKVRLSISIVLALYMITNIWNSLHSHVLNGMGKIRLQLYFSLIGTFLNVPLAIFLGKKFGIEGVVASAILLNIFSAVYSPIQVNKLIHQKAHGVWNK